jgi:heat shock protein HslJ
MTRASWTVAVIAAVGVLTCAPAGADPPTPAIGGTSWRFVEIMGAAPPEAVRPTLELSVDGAVTGDTGCNQFVGHYVSAGAELSFSDLSYTKMFCGPDVMQVEMAVQNALRRTSRTSTPPGELDLVASDGSLLARLTPLA